MQKLGFNEKIGVICVPKENFLRVFKKKNWVKYFWANTRLSPLVSISRGIVVSPFLARSDSWAACWNWGLSPAVWRTAGCTEPVEI